MVKRNKRRLNKDILFLPVSIIVISLLFVYLSSSFAQIVKTKKETIKAREKLLSLKKQESQLSNDVKKLQDPEYLEKYLREKYHYTKEGEYVIKIPKKES